MPVADPVRVLVTGAGGPAAVAFAQDVAGAGYECAMVDIDPCAAGLYLVPAERRALIPRGDAAEFVDALLERCRSWHVDVVVPTVDAELLPVARRRDDFVASGTRVLVAEVSTLEACLDKWSLLQACQGKVPVPESALLDPSLVAEELPWPLVGKPRHGSGSRGIRMLEGPDDLRALPNDGSYVVQELLPGEEFSVDVLAYLDGRVAAAVPRSRLKVDSGIAVAGRTVDDPDLIALATEVARVVGLSTVANVQFRRDPEGVAKLLEVNARFPGTMPLTVASGVDMPVLALDDLLGRPVPERVPFRPLAMVRHWSEVFLDVEELSALGSPAALGLPTGE
jgi:carbamoyl-phosphate synthase large subunit